MFKIYFGTNKKKKYIGFCNSKGETTIHDALKLCEDYLISNQDFAPLYFRLLPRDNGYKVDYGSHVKFLFLEKE